MTGAFTHIPRAACVAAILAVGQAQALTPLPPCDGIESDMQVWDLDLFAQTSAGPITIEGYADPYEPGADGVYGYRSKSIQALHEFNGVRLVNCATRRILALNVNAHPSEVRIALSATEFLRDDMQAGRNVQFRDVRSAAKAVYGNTLIELRETEATCGCDEVAAWN